MPGALLRAGVSVRQSDLAGRVGAQTGSHHRRLSSLFFRKERTGLQRSGGKAGLRSTLDSVLYAAQRTPGSRPDQESEIDDLLGFQPGSENSPANTGRRADRGRPRAIRVSAVI